MRRSGLIVIAVLALTASSALTQTQADGNAAAYLEWNAGHAKKIGEGWRVNGRVGRALDFRGLHTDRSYNYKLRATWLNRDVVWASARLAQLSDSLTNNQTAALVSEAEAAGEAVILVELDPREGSGVIPLNWSAFLGPKGASLDGESVVKGTTMPALSRMRGLSGVFRRDYNYEAFWVVFPLTTSTGAALFPSSVSHADLVVRIHDKEGRVTWPIPQSIKTEPRNSGNAAR